MNTVGQFLEMLGFSISALRKWLGIIAEKAPELAPSIGAWLAKLDEPLSSENLVAVITSLPVELSEVLKFHLDPRDHPSSGA